MTTEFLPDHDLILLTLLPDPSKVPDMLRSRRMSELYLPIHAHFELWPDVLVGSNGYLCRDGNDPDNWVKMDLVVARDVMPDAIIGRNGYIIDEVGKPPDFVLEVVPECLFYDEASDKFGLVADVFGEVRPGEVRRDYDYERNRRLFAGYGVREYWRLSASLDDPQQDVPLAGPPLGRRGLCTDPGHRGTGWRAARPQRGAGFASLLGWRPATLDADHRRQNAARHERAGRNHKRPPRRSAKRAKAACRSRVRAVHRQRKVAAAGWAAAGKRCATGCGSFPRPTGRTP